MLEQKPSWRLPSRVAGWVQNPLASLSSPFNRDAYPTGGDVESDVGANMAFVIEG
jgi:hypothetical protein